VQERKMDNGVSTIFVGSITALGVNPHQCPLLWKNTVKTVWDCSFFGTMMEQNVLNSTEVWDQWRKNLNFVESNSGISAEIRSLPNTDINTSLAGRIEDSLRAWNDQMDEKLYIVAINMRRRLILQKWIKTLRKN
jgi:hypothetical protein